MHVALGYLLWHHFFGYEDDDDEAAVMRKDEVYWEYYEHENDDEVVNYILILKFYDFGVGFELVCWVFWTFIVYKKTSIEHPL